MAIDRETPLFVDASCLIAAAGSPFGGSAFILGQCQRGLLHAIVSAPVCDEAERNVRMKLPAAMERYLDLLRIPGLQSVPEPTDRDLDRVRGLVESKGEHVLAAALAAGADYVITLDKGLEEAVTRSSTPITAHSPGTFIRTVLPQHPDYRSMRE